MDKMLSHLSASLRLGALFILVPVGTLRADLYHVHKLSEQELMRNYSSLLIEACHHADQFWKTSTFDPAAGYWGDGVSDGNQGIRAIGEMTLTCGTLLKYSGSLTEAERGDWFSKARAAIRYAAATHRTGRQKCADRKQWGGSWQSAMWTGTLGFGAWFIWDRLDHELRQDVERVVAAEANRFLDGHPPAQVWFDTKAEENGWNLICIALAANMFPGHPHAAAWEEKAREYMMNTLSVTQDLTDGTLVDGRPVKQWVTGANLQPDFTLENHGFFHPSYVACSSYFLTQTAMYYAYAGRPIPEATRHHLLDTWQMLQTILLPWGEAAFPQGMDWELHGLNFINLYASLATWQHDPLAAHMERITLQYSRAWQTMCRGDLTVPGSRLGFTRHAICAEQAAYGFLAHKIFGPSGKGMSADEPASRVQRVRDFPYVDFITQRTQNKFASFSWKNRIMGMVIPTRKDHGSNPFFSVPIINGFVGSIELGPRGNAKISVLEHASKETGSGFETTGTLSINGGRLEQRIRVTSVGERTVLYQDRITARAEISLAAERGVPLGIENDEITGGKRKVYYQGGQTVFDWQHRRNPLAIPGRWANVDGRLGVVIVAGSGLVYASAAGYDAQMGVCSDILYGSFSNEPKHFKAGEEVARRIVIFFTEVSPRKTAALSSRFCIMMEPGLGIVQFELPEGCQTDVPLLWGAP
jgi:hypothetical protein